MFLVQELACSELDVADMISLAAIDMSDGNTLADHVDPGNFEHIRLGLLEETPMDVIKELTTGYYRQLGYDVENIEVEENSERSFALMLELDGARLTVTALKEDGNILNATVV
ncbi:MAG: hypothetical protein WC735_01810 [Candidatus Paceibacterota bacterium]